MIIDTFDVALLNNLMRSSDADDEETNNKIRDAITEKGHEYVETLVKRYKISSFAAHSLKELFPSEPRWERIHAEYAKRNTTILNLLDNIFHTAEDLGCTSVCVMENFGSVLRGKACLGCFQSGDVDLSADRRDLQIIEKVMSNYGFSLEYATHLVNKYTNRKIIEGGFSLQITWVAVARKFLNQEAISKRLAECRMKANHINGTNIKVLDATEQLYFCANHIASGHYYTFSPGIRLYADIDRLVRGCYETIEWDKIIKWSKEDNIGLRVMLAIYISHKLLNTPVSPCIIEQIERSKYTIKFLEKLFDPKKLGFGCDTGKRNRLYIDLASYGVSIPHAIIKKMRG